MISPVSVRAFFATVWEKKPLCVARCDPSFYRYLCTLEDFEKALAAKPVMFAEHVDASTYADGVKTVEEAVGRATPEAVRVLRDSGRSVRLLNPQAFIRKVRCCTTKLQEFFRCFVGANIYFTPADSQGFAPHYDDVEAFVLQLHGTKEWRIYRPRVGEELPRFSSGNFTDDEIGEPMLKTVLHPGDLLYFPRGTIHQARALTEDSMHITISCFQRNSWADFLEKLLPVALRTAVDDDVEYRRGLPLDYLDHLGLVASDCASPARRKIVSRLEKLVANLVRYLPVDGCADQFGKKFVRDSLPPILDEVERRYSRKSDRTGLTSRLSRLGSEKIGVKLIRAYSCRLVCEEGTFRLYYNTRNGLGYRDVGHRCVRMPHTWVAMTELLLLNYPSFTRVAELSSTGSRSGALALLRKLSRRGLILFDRPLADS